MKAIICTSDLSMSPYVWFYANICINNNQDYVIITKGKQKVEKKGYKIITYIMTENLLKKNRILKNIYWNIWIYKIIKEYNIDNIIVTPTNTAFSIFPYLLFTFHEYLLDIRDYTYEDSFLYYMIEKILIKKAKVVIISSNGFKKWLPSSNTPFYTIHNMPYESDSLIKNDFNRIDDGYKIIGYIGYINYYDINKRLIDLLNKNYRYLLKYSGKIAESCPIEEYVQKINTCIVTFSGPYDNENKSYLYKSIDMINSIYGNNSLLVTTALPNKLYDAVIYKKPIIAAKGTFLGEIIEQHQIGFTVDIFKDDIINLLDNFWKNYDRDNFYKKCQDFYEEICAEQKNTISHILNFLS